MKQADIKKILNIMKNVLVWIVVAIAVFMMIFTLISVNMFDKNDRNLFGFRFYTVLSDSMSATDFSAGDIVIIKEVDPSTLEEGDIISYISLSSESYGEVITHKIRSRTTDENGRPGFITYGTTTNTDDDEIVTYKYILGIYKAHIPKLGYFFQFLKTTPGYIVCILVPFLLLILSQGVNCIRIFRKYKAEQMEEMQAERERIEREREENQRIMMENMKAERERIAKEKAESQKMMLELMILKARLEAQEEEKAAKAEENKGEEPKN